MDDRVAVDSFQILNNEDYDSSFEDASARHSNQNQESTAPKEISQPIGKQIALPKKSEFTEAYNREEGRIQRFHLLSLDAYSRHKKLINDYLLYYPGATEELKRDASNDKRDIDVIKEHHQFLWDEDDDEDSTWEKRLAKRYYDKLFKEYCIADLSRYKENKTGMRWRTEKEVVDGKGQFICGGRHCDVDEDLTSWEVNFAYVEHKQKKNALVKLRLCQTCSKKLNYHHKSKKAKKSRKLKSVSDFKKAKRMKTDDGVSTSSNVDSPVDNVDDTPGSDIWSAPQAIESEDKSKIEEMDDFLEDMLL